MNSRGISLGLLFLNVLLLGAILYLAWLLRRGEPAAAGSGGDIRVVTNTVTQVTVRKVNTANLLAALTNRIGSWAALESTNYAVYIANLRAFGCPEETVRDIILTDVAKLYGKRRSALRRQYQPYRFWQTEESFNASSRTNQEGRRLVRELEREQRALIRELLGVDARVELAKYADDGDATERQMGFLPPDKQARLLELQEKFRDAEEEIYLRANGLMLDQDQSLLQQLQRQRETELAQALSPEELEEYHLRNSDTANNLRGQLSGLDPSEDEFRKIFRLQKTFDDEFANAFDPTDEKQMEVRAKAQQEAQEELHAELRQSLGGERFAEYERVQDGDYRFLMQIANRFDLPKETVGRVHDMKLEAERHKQRVESAPNLTDEQRQAALTAIARETERSVSAALGDKVFKAYQRTGGQWIEGLGFGVPNIPPPGVENPGQ